MRKFFRLYKLVPLLETSQAKTIVSSFRVFSKIEKSIAFEKAFTSHA